MSKETARMSWKQTMISPGAKRRKSRWKGRKNCWNNAFASEHASYSWQTKNWKARSPRVTRSEEHTSELQSQSNLVCRLLLEKKKYHNIDVTSVFQHDLHRFVAATWSLIQL